MTYNEYMKAYRLKNRDRINARQRERRKGLKPENAKTMKEYVKAMEPIIKIESKEEMAIRAEKLEEDRSPKCCSCHLPGKHYARNRWFCDAHRP